MTNSLHSVGNIVLLISGGGMLRFILQNSGIGQVFGDFVGGLALPMVVVAFLIAAAVRVSVGSATVSMTMAAGIVASMPIVGGMTQLQLAKEGSLQDIMRSFAKEYPIKVVVATRRTVHSPKDHSFGSMIYDAQKDMFFEEEPYEHIEIVDRIGSGDAYISGALYGLINATLDVLQMGLHLL